MPRPKILLSFFATFCAIAVTFISLCSPCVAEESDAEGGEPIEAVSTQEDTS
jgi:hypothetical protein